MKSLLKKAYSILPFKQPLFRFIRLFKPSEGLYKHLHFKGTIKVNVSDGQSFKMQHFGSRIENEIFWEGLYNGWEKESMKLWVQLSKTHSNIFDIGANTGIYSLTSLTVNPKAHVTAIEPVDRVFDRLIINEQINQFDFHGLKYAASNFTGEAIIYDTGADHILSVTVNKNLNGPNTATQQITIPTKRLDEIIEEHKIEHIDLMKIDVETHEPEVLEGMGVYLKKFKPTMLIEILEDEVGEKVQKQLEGMGYLYFNIDELKGTVRRVEKITKSDYYNYLVCSEAVAVNLNLEF